MKRYQVIDLLGRKWAETLTKVKAAKYVIDLYKTKGLTCTIREVML